MRNLIDYSDPKAVARQNISPNAACEIDGQFVDARNLVHLVATLAAEVDQLRLNEKDYQAAYDAGVQWKSRAEKAEAKVKLLKIVIATKEKLHHRIVSDNIASAEATAAVKVSQTDILREWFGDERYARDYEYLDASYGRQADRVVAYLSALTTEPSAPQEEPDDDYCPKCGNGPDACRATGCLGDEIAAPQEAEAAAWLYEWRPHNVNNEWQVAVSLTDPRPSGVREYRNVAPLYTYLPAQAATEARPLDEWHEDFGDVVWWAWQDGAWLGEPSYIGTPNDSDWPGYHTHWSPHPTFPVALTAAQEAGR